MKNLFKLVFAIIFISIFSQSFAQSVGDFGSLGSGNWGTNNTNWRKWDGVGWNTIPAGAPTASDNVYIRSGHIVTVEATGKNCANLIIESNAQLLSTVSYGRQINIYGSIICNGQIGNGTANYNISFRFFATDCSISGNGIFDANYIQKGYTTNATTNLTIAMNVNLRLNDIALYNLSATATDATFFNITINSGVTLDFPTGGGSIGIDGGSSSTPSIYENGGTITVNGTLNLTSGAGGLYLQTDNVSAHVGLVIGNGGIVNIDYIDLSSTGSIKPSLTVANNGLLNLTQSGNCPSGQSTIDLQSGSTVKYHYGGNQNIHAWTYHNLKIGGSYNGTKTLEGNTTVNGKLTLMETCTMASGGYSLTYGPSASLEYLGSNTTSDVEWPATFSKDITVNSTGTVILNGSKNAYSGTLTFSGGTFDVGAFELAGTGAFLMSGSTKILSSHANGIGATGNFKLAGTQTFSTTGEYEFNSSSSNQFTGSNLPTTIGRLIINNSFSGSGTVYLSNNISISGYLYRYNGTLNLNGKTLTYESGSELLISHGVANMTAGDEFFSTMNVPVTVNGSGQFILSKDITLNATLTLVGRIDISSYNLTLGSSATIGGTPSSTVMIYSSSTGELRKTFSSNGSFTFPIGDNTGTTEYSPCYINLTADAYSSAYVGIKVVNSKHSSNTSSTDYLNRYWTLSSSGLTNPNYSAEFTYVDADIIGTESNLYGGKYSGSAWSGLGTVDALNNKVTVSGQTSFSDFTAGEQSALPVELTSFNTAVENNIVTLNWQTATEVNNYGFEIERQAGSKEDGVNSMENRWAKIGFVNGNGNSNSPKNYSFLDEPSGGRVFKYRLKQIDFNGTFEYSEEVAVVLENVIAFKLGQNYPNPFNPITKISWQLPVSSHVTLIVYDVLGNEVATLVDEYKTSGVYHVEFDGSKLASGVYFYKLTADNFSQAKKLILMK